MKNKSLLTISVAFAIVLAIGVLVFGQEFAGLDETTTGIANQFAEKVGAGEREPFINTDKGDLLLFLFTIAGLGAGFYLGYHCRDLFGGKPEQQ